MLIVILLGARLNKPFISIIHFHHLLFTFIVFITVRDLAPKPRQEPHIVIQHIIPLAGVQSIHRSHPSTFSIPSILSYHSSLSHVLFYHINPQLHWPASLSSFFIFSVPILSSLSSSPLLILRHVRITSSASNAPLNRPLPPSTQSLYSYSSMSLCRSYEQSLYITYSSILQILIIEE